MIPVPIDIGQGEGVSLLRVLQIAMMPPLDSPRALGGIASGPYTTLLDSLETMVPEGLILKKKKKSIRTI